MRGRFLFFMVGIFLCVNVWGVQTSFASSVPLIQQKHVKKSTVNALKNQKNTSKNTAKKASKNVQKKVKKNKTISTKKTASKIVQKHKKHPIRVRKNNSSFLSANYNTAKLPLRSSQALVVTESGKVLFEKNADSVQPIASITKLMTAMVVLDANLDMDEVIEITEEDVDRLKNSRSRLKIGTRLSRATALLLALMSSENRAASALGRNYPGGMDSFVADMNQKAQELGMKHSYFAEPTGLSSQNVSNAFDLSKMVLAAAKYPAIRYFSTMNEVDVALGKRVQTFHNTNALIDNKAWQIGISKTGYISEAGRCLVMQAIVANKPVVIVLLDSLGKRSREGDANRIKTWMENKAQLTAMNAHSNPR